MHILGGYDGGKGIQAVHHLHVLHKVQGFLAAVGIGIQDSLEDPLQFGAGTDGAFKLAVDIQTAELRDGAGGGTEDLIAEGFLIQHLIRPGHGDGEFGGSLHLEGIIRIDHAAHRHIRGGVKDRGLGDIPHGLSAVFQLKHKGFSGPILQRGGQYKAGGHRSG